MRWVMGLVSLAACASPAPAPRPAPPSATAAPVVVSVPEPEAAPPAASVTLETPPPTKLSRLVSLSVQTRLPELAAEHRDDPGYGHIGHDLATRAIAAAERDMVVTFVGSAKPVSPVALYTINDSGAFVPWPEPNVSQGGLASFGVETWFGYAPSATGYVLFVHGDAPALAPGTPGLVWEAKTGAALFLSLDGETYEVPLDERASSLKVGVPPVADWPAINPVFGRMAFATVRRDQSTLLGKSDEAFERCADFIWTATKKKMPAKQREEAWAPDSKVVLKHCAATIRAWEEAFAKNVRASAEKRRALLDEAKDRLAPPAGGGG